MLSDLRDLLKQASEPSDIATILLAGTAGFVIDAGLNVVGFLEPGIVGLTFATTALGAKQAYTAASKDRKARHAADKKRDEQIRKAKQLIEVFEGEQQLDLSQAVRRELKLLESGAITDENAEAAFAAIVQRYRDSQST